MTDKCPECETELTEYEGQHICEICGFVLEETPEERYSRAKAYKQKRMKELGYP